jgi:hypothetical protein
MTRLRADKTAALAEEIIPKVDTSRAPELVLGWG